MAKKKKENTTSKLVEKQEQDIYVAEETIEIKEDAQNIKENLTENDVIDAAVKEYNGEIKEENNEEKRIRIRDNAGLAKIHKINKKVIVITCSVIFALIISLIAFGVINKLNSNVYTNIHLNDKNLSGMTTAEVTDMLNIKQEEIKKVSLKVFQENEKILEIMSTDIDFQVDIEATHKQIFEYGRKSNILKNNFDVLYALIFKKDFDYIYKYDVSKLSAIVKEIKESLDNKVIDDSYVVDENQYKLIITRGKSGNTIEEEELKKQIIAGLANAMGEYKLNIIKGTPKALDVDVIHSNVKRDAEDAYVDKSLEVYKFVPHRVGLDFNKDDLETILSQNDNKQEGKIIEYSLTVIQPKVKTSDIKWDMYEYKISSYTTYFSTSDPNRVNNLKVALNLLNGKVIMPGEVFSYNSVVGAATAAQGFKAAATFVAGRVVNEVGGGICQTVSTLYNTALLANLEIVQRKAHSLPVAYVPGSRDATVYYPSIDFKFKNTREYPIKIVTNFNSSGNLTISLYGTKQENEYVVSISSKTISTIPYKTEYINDGNLERGTQQVIQNGTNGYTSEAYITKKLNGQVVSTTLLSKDTYKAVNRIVKVGTKEVPVVVPVPNVPNDSGNGNSNVNSGTNTTEPIIPTVPDAGESNTENQNN